MRLERFLSDPKESASAMTVSGSDSSCGSTRASGRRPRPASGAAVVSQSSLAAAAFVAVALALVLGPVGASSARSAVAEPWAYAFGDPGGDAPGAPDVTQIAISGTERQGHTRSRQPWPISHRIPLTALDERLTSGWTRTRTRRLDRPAATSTTCIFSRRLGPRLLGHAPLGRKRLAIRPADRLADVHPGSRPRCGP